ncbi:MAG TPA: TetR/AcrR family transcriptional regulator [Anaerolineales bacterium]|nr:TetR/AcrR family transcriptional regulator [Anaerolineales bacterium]
MAEKTTTKRIILEAVVTCIEKYGIDKLTTRKIAEEAGTNIASINYHFRSKEELITETLSMTIKHMTDDVNAAMDDTQQPFEKRLEDVFFYLLDGCLHFPGISTAHLYKAISEKKYDAMGAQAIRNVFDRLVKKAVEEYPKRDAEEIRVRLSQIFSSILFSMLAPNFLSVPKKFQLTSSDNARRLAASYVETFIE